jgi:hypothetical protein
MRYVPLPPLTPKEITMATIEVSQSPTAVYIRAYGGTRRERGAAIGIEVRRLRQDGYVLARYHTSYSETYGFQTLTESVYTKETNA